MYLINRAKFIIITTSLISIISWSGFFELRRLAAQAQFLPPFAGIILDVEVCTCSGSLNILIGPPFPAQLLYYPGISLLYPMFQIFRPGPYALGLYVPGATCLIAQKYCTPATVPPWGIMMMVGTSL